MTLLGAAGEQLAHWKLPRYVGVVSQSLPRLANGKLDRRRIKDSFDVSAAWDRLAQAAPATRGAHD